MAPSVEDFEAQLDGSVVAIERAGEHVLFDRCPADLLAYLLVHGRDIGAAVERSRDAMHLPSAVEIRRSVGSGTTEAELPRGGHRDSETSMCAAGG